jgi:hypothetical protein
MSVTVFVTLCVRLCTHVCMYVCICMCVCVSLSLSVGVRVSARCIPLHLSLCARGFSLRGLACLGMADAVTVQWLKQHLHPVFGWPAVVRFSWGTATHMLDAQAAAVVWYEPP